MATEYKVLFKDGNNWVEWEKTVEAASARAAIRKALNGVKDSLGGELVAVPARSWQPVKVAVETALKFSS